MHFPELMRPLPVLVLLVLLILLVLSLLLLSALLPLLCSLGVELRECFVTTLHSLVVYGLSERRTYVSERKSTYLRDELFEPPSSPTARGRTAVGNRRRSSVIGDAGWCGVAYGDLWRCSAMATQRTLLLAQSKQSEIDGLFLTLVARLSNLRNCCTIDETSLTFPVSVVLVLV